MLTDSVGEMKVRVLLLVLNCINESLELDSVSKVDEKPELVLRILKISKEL